MSLQPTKTKKQTKVSPAFKVDGLSVLVRSLAREYKMGYRPVGKEPYTVYDLFGDANHFKYIGRAFLSDRGIEVRLDHTVRETLISMGHSVIHPESGLYEQGHTEVEEFANVASWVVGDYDYETTDFGFTILREGES